MIFCPKNLTIYGKNTPFSKNHNLSFHIHLKTKQYSDNFSQIIFGDNIATDTTVHEMLICPRENSYCEKLLFPHEEIWHSGMVARTGWL